jgi:large subunit ribosomal protein L18
MLAWAKRKARVKRKIQGTAQKPRLTVSRSLNHIYAQVIDDGKGVTLVSASTLSSELKGAPGHKGNVAAARMVGEAIAKICQKAGITRVVFDRNGYLYHGRVKALAEAARENGLDF